MSIRRLQRSVRCFFKYGPRRCPHIERHSRRRTHPDVEAAAPEVRPAFRHPINIAPLPDGAAPPPVQGPARGPLSG